MGTLEPPAPIDANNKPPLDPATWETIIVAQYHIHGRYTERLQQFVILGTPFSMVNLARQIEEVTAAQSRIPSMPRPKQPTALCAVLRDYAERLFDTEAVNYPSGTQLSGWLSSLRLRIENLIAQRIDQIEKVSESGNGLSYHATQEQMRSAIHDALKGRAQNRPIEPMEDQTRRVQVPTNTMGQLLEALAEPLRLVSPPLSAKEEIVSTPIRQRSQADLKAERRALVESYLGSFSEKIIIRDICWAAKQRYREWTRWLNGILKDGCKADKAFRAVISSGKLPAVYRSEPRPKTWF